MQIGQILLKLHLILNNMDEKKFKWYLKEKEGLKFKELDRYGCIEVFNVHDRQAKRIEKNLPKGYSIGANRDNNNLLIFK